MKKIACQYAIVRFMPFIETGEFANAGIVMMAPKDRYFGFKLETKRYGRITRFFEEIDNDVYRKALYNVKDELERAGNVLKTHGFDRRLKSNDLEFANRLFHEIVRERETVIQFGETRTVLTDNPKEKLKQLFAFYVERNFISKQYQETLLEKSVRSLLFQAEVGEQFIRDRIGDDNYHVNFPFVENVRKVSKKIIKPLHLAHPEPTKIYEHGAAWAFRVRKLRGKFLDINSFLFALGSPADDANCYQAYQEVMDDLIDIGVHVTTMDQESEIVDFATA